MRVVLDTNVLLAAFATRGLCEAVVGACLHSHAIILCEHILTELDENLDQKFRVPQAQRRDIQSLLRRHAELVEPLLLPPQTCRDLDDLPVLGAATFAEVLVTGDKDLLDLASIHGVPILSPRQFHERMR